MTTDTGGPAFPSGLTDPSTPEDSVESLHKGMTLRDYFAAKLIVQCIEVCSTHTRAAEEAYAMADAMLKARTP
jgi:hypothetical protein